jgi:hypothetical protein
MAEPENDDAGHGRSGALEALLEVAEESDIVHDYATAHAACDREDYEALITLAWRHQFNDDRTKFKRELRELQEHVSQRILELLEVPE